PQVSRVPRTRAVVSPANQRFKNKRSVPKRAIFFWGADKMSWLRYMTLWTFRQCNPGWRMQLYRAPQRRFEKYWTERVQQDFFRYTGPNYLDLLPDISGLEVIDWEPPPAPGMRKAGPSHLSNIFKWQQMAEEGGVYVDMDIVCVRPLTEWYKLIEKGSSLCWRSEKRYFSIGLLGSQGNSQFYQDVLRNAIKCFSAKVYQSVGVETLYRLYRKVGKPGGPNVWQRIVRSYPEERFVNFKMHHVYPWDSTQVAHMFQRELTVIPKATWGIHWYAGHPIAQKANNHLDERTVWSHRSTVAHFLREMLKAHE
ncbi:hypothetical protein LCGC14_2302330, partial [marine sediment metagenome]